MADQDAPDDGTNGRRPVMVTRGRDCSAFAEDLRDEVDLIRLRAALVDTVENAVRPVSATVWLRAGAGVAR